VSYELDATGFADELSAQLAGAANGYSLELRRSGETVLPRSSGTAIDGQLEGGVSTAWSPDVSMHIASCSKLLTAMALTKILGQQPGLSPDDAISPYLPSYWDQGPNVDLVTFTDVMTHNSGLKPPTGPGVPADQTYVPCREAVALGVADASKIGGSAQLNYQNWDYQNTNFVLCRVLMATVSGALDVNATYTGPHLPPDGSPIIVQPPGHHLTQQQVNDDYWDAVTVQFYEQYLQNNVFAPADVAASLGRPDICALAYAWPSDNQPGWNSGDLSDWAGPAGYHMSVSDLLDVMGTFRRSGTILSPGEAQAMLDSKFGIDWGANGVPGVAKPTPAGPLYCKNGCQYSKDGAGNARVEQCGAVFLPLDMECVLFVNSPIDQPGQTPSFLLSAVNGAFINNLEQVAYQLGGHHHWGHMSGG
jgi:CubicO group peptidase (beta-lactamase class C family)